MEEKIKVLSLFSSGGVAEAHLEDLGIEILIANEIRKDRCPVAYSKERKR